MRHYGIAIAAALTLAASASAQQAVAPSKCGAADEIGAARVYSNGSKWAGFAAFDGLKKLGVEKIPPIVARGVVLDMTAHFKADPVPEGTAFNRAEIDAAAKAQGVEIREGDVVLFY